SYIPTAADDAGERNVLRRIRHRRAAERAVFVKSLIPGELIRRRKATVLAGSHGLKRYGRIWHRKHAHQPAPGLALAHFPVRSAEQIVGKALVGWPAQLARGDRKPDEGGQWELLYNRFRGGELPSAEELTTLALRYGLRADAPDQGASPLELDPVRPVGRW